MKDANHKNDKIQWFEWAMLFIAIGIIFVSICKVEADGNDRTHRKAGSASANEVIETEPVAYPETGTIHLLSSQAASRSIGYPAPSKDWSNLGIHDVNFQKTDVQMPDVPGTFNSALNKLNFRKEDR